MHTNATLRFLWISVDSRNSATIYLAVPCEYSLAGGSPSSASAIPIDFATVRCSI
jgi:hypothetical protein